MYLPKEVLQRIEFEQRTLSQTTTIGSSTAVDIKEVPGAEGQEWDAKFERFCYKTFIYRINWWGQIIGMEIENNAGG